MYLLFNRILVSDVTKQMTHDGLVWHANIHVPHLKCQLSAFASVLTYQLRDIYISMSQSPSYIICILLLHDDDMLFTSFWYAMNFSC